MSSAIFLGRPITSSFSTLYRGAYSRPFDRGGAGGRAIIEAGGSLFQIINRLAYINIDVGDFLMFHSV